MTDLHGGSRAKRRGSEEYFNVVDTFWGYIVGPPGQARRRASLGESLAMIGSLAFGGIAFSLWLLPGSTTDTALMPFKIGATAVFFVIAGLLYLMAKKGLSSEVQIDLHEREIRVVRRNCSDESVTLEAHSFDLVQDIAVKRSRRNLLWSALGVDVLGATGPIVLATAPERELTALFARLGEDLLAEPAEALIQQPAEADIDLIGDQRVPSAFAAR